MINNYERAYMVLYEGVATMLTKNRDSDIKMPSHMLLHRWDIVRDKADSILKGEDNES